jgi:TolA-binding protein
MTFMLRVVTATAVAGAVVLAASVASAQAPRVTTADIQRLQDNVYLAERDISQLRTRDAARANQLQSELDELSDEVVYLRVKLRKERTLARSEFSDLETRIDGVRNRARGTGVTSSTSSAPAAPAAPAPPAPPAPPAAPAPPAPARTSTAREIPAGTELDLRLSSVLNSGTAKVEDRFEATTAVDLIIDGRTLVPAGAVARGVVASVEPATRTNRTARMTLTFDQLTVGTRSYPIRGTVTQAIEGEGIKGETARVGTGAGVGAIIGGILGGFKGAMAGILIGGGGTIAATEGKEVELPPGSVLRVRIESAVPLQ